MFHLSPPPAQQLDPHQVTLIRHMSRKIGILVAVALAAGCKPAPAPGVLRPPPFQPPCNLRQASRKVADAAVVVEAAAARRTRRAAAAGRPRPLSRVRTVA